MNQSRTIRFLSVGILVVYFALGLLASACPVDVSQAAEAHHHGQAHHGAVHSLLCAWACQANAAAHLNASQMGGQPALLLIGMVLALYAQSDLVRRKFLRSRAPPR